MPDNDSESGEEQYLRWVNEVSGASSDGGDTSSGAGDSAAAKAGTSDDNGSGEVGHREDAVARDAMGFKDACHRLAHADKASGALVLSAGGPRRLEVHPPVHHHGQRGCANGCPMGCRGVGRNERGFERMNLL